jgi:hypothetical protein
LADQQKKHSSRYQHRNQNTDDERSDRMPLLGRLRSRAFLRRSKTQPEEKFVHLGFLGPQKRYPLSVCDKIGLNFLVLLWKVPRRTE